MKVTGIPKELAKHLEQYKRSQLTQAEYCRNNKLGYHQFGYWRRKANKNPQGPLIPIQLATVERASDVLCSLTFSRGIRLEIYDVQALSAILERLA